MICIEEMQQDDDQFKMLIEIYNKYMKLLPENQKVWNNRWSCVYSKNQSI